MNILETTNFLKQKINLIEDLEIRGAVLDSIDKLLELIGRRPIKLQTAQLNYFHTPIDKIMEILDELNTPFEIIGNLPFSIEIVDYGFAVINYNGLQLLTSDEINDFYIEETDKYLDLKTMIQKSLKKLRKKIKRSIND
jgi:hypothetical protein